MRAGHLDEILGGQLWIFILGKKFLYLFANCWLGPLASVGIASAPVKGRSVAVGFTIAFANSISLTFGPTAIGALIDHYSALYGDLALQRALLWLLGAAPIGIALIWYGSKAFTPDRSLHAH